MSRGIKGAQKCRAATVRRKAIAICDAFSTKVPSAGTGSSKIPPFSLTATPGGGKRPAVCSAGFVSRDQEQNGNKSSAWQSRRRRSWRNPHQYCSREQIE